MPRRKMDQFSIKKYTKTRVAEKQSYDQAAESLLFDLETDARDALLEVLGQFIWRVRYDAVEIRKLKKKLVDAQSRIKQLERDRLAAQEHVNSLQKECARMFEK